MSKKVLITGAAGFLGRYCVRAFSRSGWTIAGVDVVPPENAALGAGVAYRRLSLPSDALSELIAQEEPAVCVHCAGRASVPFSLEDPGADFRDSAVITFELLDALRTRAPACRVIFLSSAAIYGNPRVFPVREEHAPAPLSPYGFHKRQCELLCEEFSTVYGMRTTSARIFSAYGPGLRRQVVWDICQKALGEDCVQLRGTGRESRDFVHAADVARALVLLAERAPAQGETYNVATGQETTVAELAKLVLAALGRKDVARFDGINPPGNPVRWQADISRLHTLGFSTSFALEEGVHQVADWCVAERRGG